MQVHSVKKPNKTRKIVALLIVMGLLSNSSQLLAGDQSHAQPVLKENSAHVVLARGQYNQMPNDHHDDEKCG